MQLHDPYQSRSLKLINNSQVTLNINKYIALEYAYLKNKEKVKIKSFENHHTTLNPVILYGLTDIEKEIPTFNHPLINTDNKWIALDLRHYVSLNPTKDDYAVKNDSEYSLAIQRFILTGLWFVGKQQSAYSLKLAHFAFANWLSENLTRKFGLDMGNQLQLKILGLIFYAGLFGDEFTSDDYTKLVIRSKEDILVPGLIDEVYERCGPVGTIEEFCEACYKVTGNIRLKGVDYTILINILNNNWIGSNGKELAMLSLEHPPTWLSLVYASLSQRSFKKNFIATVVERLDKRGKGEEFLNAMFAITNEQLVK